MGKLRIEKRGKVWQYRFEIAKIEGSRKTISKSGFKTKQEAINEGTAAMEKYNNYGNVFKPSEISVHDFFNLWLEEYCKINLKKTTYDNYKKRIETHILPELGKYRLKSITPIALQEFINKMAKENFSRNTLTNIKGILNQSMDYAVMHGFILRSPMEKIRLPNARSETITPRSDPHIFIPENQIEAIFNRFPEKTSPHIPMMFAYKAGLRLGEAFAVFWDNIDFDNYTLTVSKQVQWNDQRKEWYFSNPKYDSFRTIDIDAELVALLKRELLNQKKTRLFYGPDYVRLYEDDSRTLNTEGKGKEIFLVNVRGDGSFISPRTMQHTSYIIHHRLGIKGFDFHSFRGTHATMLAEQDVPIKYLQTRLGHKNANVTMKYYIHVTDKTKDKGNQILNEIYEKHEIG